MSRLVLVLVANFVIACQTVSANARTLVPVRVEARRVAEVTLTTAHPYRNPFVDVDLDAIVTAPDGRETRVPAFWDGDGVWRFRYSSSALGPHTFRTVCSDVANAELNGVKGTIEVTPYTGDNPLYSHGPVRIAPDHRHFEYSDGTPFFWLGDTWWKGLSKRISIDGFKQLAADRKSKGFSVVQIVAGPYPDEPAFDPRWENDAGMPYRSDYLHVNPAYFDDADKRIRELTEASLVPAIVGGWGWHMPAVGVQNFTRHWRYLTARYGAFPVVWIIGGEAAGQEWTQIARAVRTLDPFHRPITIHPPSPSSSRRSVTDESVLDFDMLQTGHDNWGAAPYTVEKLTAAVSKIPPMPSLIGEVTYEGHMMGNREELQRFMFWSSMLNGAAGHTYGAGGIMQMNSESVRGAEYEFTPWFQAMHLPGAAELGVGKRLLEEYPWWRFQPHPEWIEPHSTTLLQPHSDWFDDERRWAAQGGRYDLPYAGGIPGEVRFVFIPGGHAYNWHAPTVVGLEPDASYRAYYFDPALGRRFALGTLARSVHDGVLLTDRFGTSASTGWKDFGTKTERGGGRLLAGKDMVTAVANRPMLNAEASVGASGYAEAGIVLRFHDPDNYVVALYSPSLHAIYLHDRKNGQWGEQLGRVDIPAFGPQIRLTAAIAGDSATLTVTDGTQTYSTSSARLENVSAGLIGLWHYHVGDTQQFDNFEMSGIHLSTAAAKPIGEPLILSENPGVLPAAPIPSISILVTNRYQPPRLPVPQDWILVLETIHG